MAADAKQRYYDDTENRNTREDLKLAVTLSAPELPRTAIDCGCGAGSDIAFLRDAGFEVHAFDIEPEAINRCQIRFQGDKGVHLSCTAFENFDYPRSSLINADAALSFCPSHQFDAVWQKITEALPGGGVFCGSFVGPEDTMASPDYDGDSLWPDVNVFNEADLRENFNGFDIHAWQEHRVTGEFQEAPYDWHIFAVVAVRRNV